MSIRNDRLVRSREANPAAHSAKMAELLHALNFSTFNPFNLSTCASSTGRERMKDEELRVEGEHGTRNTEHGICLINGGNVAG